MRLKTLGVLLVTAMAVFTALYWLTDEGRRNAVFNKAKWRRRGSWLSSVAPTSSDRASAMTAHAKGRQTSNSAMRHSLRAER